MAISICCRWRLQPAAFGLETAAAAFAVRLRSGSEILTPTVRRREIAAGERAQRLPVAAHEEPAASEPPPNEIGGSGGIPACAERS